MDYVSYLSLGGNGEVTRNMHLYQYGDEILIVDCGIGFADNSVPGIDLLIPDTSYLKNIVGNASGQKNTKRIVGMVLSHGHEDHIGALPFVLPFLPNFPIYASSLTANFANLKLKDFGQEPRVKIASFEQSINLGAFTVNFARMTHSVVDTANIFIKTPIGNFYHGSDFKFDFTPVDGKSSEIRKIAKWGDEGILCTLSDSLGAERKGHSESELKIGESFDNEFRNTKGKVFVTTYSSNISRMNQAIEAAIKNNRKICFIGRSFLKARDIGRKLRYMNYPDKIEIKPQQVKRLNPSNVLILIAGSQAQVDSGLSRIAQDQDNDIRIQKGDTVIFSADPIPGNEVNINHLIDTISKKEARVVYSDLTSDFHVSGHGYENDLKLLISLTNPKFVLPIGGTYRHMVAYRDIARMMGYRDDEIIFANNSQEVIFTQNGYRFGKTIKTANTYVDQITNEPVDKFIVLDRKKIAEEGVFIVLSEINSQTGQLMGMPDLITKGFSIADKEKFAKRLEKELNLTFGLKKDKVVNWMFYRKIIQQKTEGLLFKQKREPLVVSVVIEV